MKDLTKGNEAKLIFYFALPMLIGNVFQQLYNTVDSIVVGRFIGEKALAAVGASFPIMFLLIALIIGITMGTTILIAQYYGAKDFEKVKRTIDTAYIFLFFASIAITIIGLISSGPLLRLLNVPEEIMPQAKAYLNIIFLGMTATFGYNSISGILRGLGDSKTPLYFLIISTVMNIILDLLFVVAFNWGVQGAAWATIIAQAFSFIVSYIYLKKTHELFKFKIKEMVFDKKIFGLSLKIGMPSGVQQMFVAGGLMALQSIVNGFGTNTIAAYTAAGRLDSFASMPAMNFSAAISTFVGQNMGAGKPERVRKGFITTLIMSSLISIFISIAVIMFGRQLIWLFNSNEEVINIGVRYLTIVGSFYIVFSAMFITNGVLRGAGDTLIPMFVTILSLWVIRIPISKFLSVKIGSDGIWWGIPIAWTAGILLSFGYYITGRWKRKAFVKGIEKREYSDEKQRTIK